jgi:HAD superfamily hydrolase (TIGR01450 family)
MTTHIDFRTLALRYKVIFFDAYGVLKNHDGIIPGVPRTIEFLAENNIDFFILTNDASRSPEELVEAYHRAGIESITPDKLISSGLLAHDFLQEKVNYGYVAYLGTVRSAHYVETLGLKTIPIGELELGDIENINALVLLDDEGFDWQHDVNKAINLLRQRNMPVIVANQDRTYPTSSNEVAVAIGGLSNMMEQMVGKKFLRFGKPDTQIFHYVWDRIKDRGDLRKKDILMVGDTLLTDILGGNKFGIDTALVLTGNTLPNRADARIEATGIIPTYICDTVAMER